MSKKIVGYWQTYAAYRRGEAMFEVNDIDPTLFTHLIYTFLGAREDGTVFYLDPYLDLEENNGRGYIRKFLNLKSRSPSTKFMFSIGGWNAGTATFSKIAASPSSREKFARSVLEVIKANGFDGFDLDWEYPGASDKANFVRLLQTLRQHLGSKVLTVAVGAAEFKASQAYDIPNVANMVDFINLMSYDLHGSWDGITGINAPLYAGPKDRTPHQKQLNWDSIVKYWIRSGCPSYKLVPGIPLYGRSFTLDSSDSSVGAPASQPGQAGSFIDESGFLAYNEIAHNIKYNGWRRNWEDKQKVPYAVRGNQWVGYDDEESINHKLNFIRGNQLGGVMFWSIDTDDFKGINGKGKFPLVKLARNL